MGRLTLVRRVRDKQEAKECKSTWGLPGEGCVFLKLWIKASEACVGREAWRLCNSSSKLVGHVYPVIDSSGKMTVMK